jgi:hypothetical protein
MSIDIFWKDYLTPLNLLEVAKLLVDHDNPMM